MTIDSAFEIHGWLSGVLMARHVRS